MSPESRPVVAIMQPTFLPWLGYFDLIDRVDAFVVLDDVELSKQSFQTRNRVQGVLPEPRWLSIRHERKANSTGLIRDVGLVSGSQQFESFAGILRNAYPKSPNLETFLTHLAGALTESRTVGELNTRLIRHFMAELGISTPILMSSSFTKSPDRSQRLADIVQELGARLYVTVPGAVDYIHQDGLQELLSCDIAIHTHEPVEYRQSGEGFTPYLSVVDAVLEVGSTSVLDLVRQGRQDLQPL